MRRASVEVIPEDVEEGGVLDSRRLEADLARTQRAVLLWKKPVMTDREVPAAVGLAASTFSLLKAAGDAPRSFLIGRRRFYLRAEVLRWLRCKNG